jgi:hypothetical protein
MKEKKLATEDRYSELRSKIKEHLLKFEELRGFL